MRGMMYENNNVAGPDGAAICRLWGAKAKVANPGAAGQLESDRDLIARARGAMPPRATRGGRIGTGDVVIPAHAPVVAAFAPKATGPRGRAGAQGAWPSKTCGCRDGEGTVRKPARAGGCGCGRGPGASGRT
jgi:hypothetical protein